MSHILRILVILSLCSATAQTLAKNSWSFESDSNLSIPMVIGNLDSSIHVVEYRSLTCSHCADFASNGFVHLKENYIDTELINFELRPLPLNPLDLNAFKLLYCTNEDSLFEFDKTLLKNQKKWFITKDAKTWKDAMDQSEPELLKQGALFGVSKERYESCILNEDLNTLIQTSLDSAKKYKVNSTPSFIINGDLYEGNLSNERIDEILKGYID